METDEISSQIEDLSGTLDDLEESLAPILNQGLSASSNKLPLLDKAKLYVLATYALESVLFSALRLNGVDAKAHPLFNEIIRVKKYFQKVDYLEKESTGPKHRTTTLDKEAAGRFIKHGLAGNEQYDRERKERLDNQLAGAKRKLEELEGPGSHSRFSHAAKKIQALEGENGSTSEQDGGDSGEKEGEGSKPVDKRRRKKRNNAERRLAQIQEAESTHSGDQQDATSGSRQLRESEDAGDGMSTTDGDTPNKAKGPRTHKETFSALLRGPLPSRESHKKRGKKDKKTEKVAAAGEG